MAPSRGMYWRLKLYFPYGAIGSIFFTALCNNDEDLFILSALIISWSTSSTMKVAPTNGNVSQKKSKLLISLIEDPELYTLDWTNLGSWELCRVSADANSMKYKFQAGLCPARRQKPNPACALEIDCAQGMHGTQSYNFDSATHHGSIHEDRAFLALQLLLDANG